MSKLENWGIVNGVFGNWKESPTPYDAPESITHHLNGEIWNDSRFANGANVTTSTIKGKRDGNVITKSGTVYELGDPHCDYELAFPNAKERLMNSLPEIPI